MQLSEIVGDLRRGMLPANVYSDPELFELEQERLFARAWTFLAHESEIPHPGDYVVRNIVHDSFIVTRDEDGEIQALFNMCLHRGMQVCRSERGNTSHFRCPYHAWTYKNTGALVGVPFHKDAYGGEEGLRRANTTLLKAPRVDTYNGLIFVSLADEGPSLGDYLGGMRFYLDFYLAQSDEGAEVHGPQRFRVKANWKIAAENFAGDSYHTPHTHASIVDINLFGAPKAAKRKEGACYFADVGGGTSYKIPTDGGFEANLEHVGYPAERAAVMRRAWSAEQQRLVGVNGFMLSAAGILPNLAFVHNWPEVDREGTVAPFISMRQWRPVSPTETEVLSWFVVDRTASEKFKADCYKAYLMCFGSSGMFEQDDVENWTSITSMARGQMARRLSLNSRMGLRHDGEEINAPVADWPGPGRAFTGFGEHNQRAWWGRYCDYIEDDGTPGHEANGAPAQRTERIATIGG